MRHASEAPFIDQTLSVWQPLTSRRLTPEDARQIAENITGVFLILSEWDQPVRRRPRRVGNRRVVVRARTSPKRPPQTKEMNDAMPHDNNGDEHATPRQDTSANSADLFDLSRLRLSQDYDATLGVKKALLTVPARKPHRQWFVRVHPDPSWRLQTAVVDFKEDRESYLVDPDLWAELPGELVPVALFTAINRQGVVFLWPVRLPGEDGRLDTWNRSAFEATDLATTGWVRVTANMSLGAYDVFQARPGLPDPVWPEVEFRRLLELAFKDRFIHTLDHPVVRRLRGEL